MHTVLCFEEATIRGGLLNNGGVYSRKYGTGILSVQFFTNLNQPRLEIGVDNDIKPVTKRIDKEMNKTRREEVTEIQTMKDNGRIHLGGELNTQSSLTNREPILPLTWATCWLRSKQMT